ncbi:MAG: DUF1684 domain-containing protein [Anaerolineaceae bacterium]|nr:DUF1684 domain-containing protein [Anaerolineaceae bacterium]
MNEKSITPSHFETLLDYRRSVAENYAFVRQSSASPEQTLFEFRRRRDTLFATHPESALSEEQKLTFKGLNYFPYNPKLRFVLPVEQSVEQQMIEIDLPDDGLMRLQRFGRIHFEVDGQTVTLSVFWVMGYGGGIFLPFRDETYRTETYGGGRYVLDTIKHADLGGDRNGLVIDFNYAYNPSCAYNPRWVCPLSPTDNRLPVVIEAGELNYIE